MIYGRTVQLSPLVVLIAVLVGAELAGILGALAAIPIAGAIQVIVRDQLAARRGRLELEPAAARPPSQPSLDPPNGRCARAAARRR